VSATVQRLESAIQRIRAGTIPETAELESLLLHCRELEKERDEALARLARNERLSFLLGRLARVAT
jgi:hypothetical protein